VTISDLITLDGCFKYRQNDLISTPKVELSGYIDAAKREGPLMEVHFGKPVVARVRKCRLVVVKKRRPQDEGQPEAGQ
jgi:hypothetical protein